MRRGLLASLTPPACACRRPRRPSRVRGAIRRSTRTPNPSPVSRSAMPTTMPNSATFSARKLALSAVVSAVSVIQMLRTGLSSGWPLGLLQRLGRVARALAVGACVPRQLGVGEATGRLERVDPHVAREVTGPLAGVDRLAGDVGRRQLDAGRKACLLRLRRDGGCVHVGRADDLLQREAVVDRVAAVDAHGDRDDAERRPARPLRRSLRSRIACASLLPSVVAESSCRPLQPLCADAAPGAIRRVARNRIAGKPTGFSR